MMSEGVDRIQSGSFFKINHLCSKKQLSVVLKREHVNTHGFLERLGVFSSATHVHIS
jgi:hypothetical protein